MQRSGGRMIVLCVVLASAVTATARASDDAAAVRAAARKYAAAVASGDADKVGQAWTESGDYIDASGRSHRVGDLVKQMVGRPRDGSDFDPSSKVNTSADPRHPHPALSQRERGSVVPAKSSLRFVTPAVAIEDGAYDCGAADDGSALSGRFTAVWVKQNGRWLLDSLREAVSASPPMDDELQPLAWLLGEWVAEDGDAVMLVSARLSERGNYIVREFAVIGSGGETTATERIAWDPTSREFRSWTFDSQDGRGEARWKRDGDGWRVETKEVMDDGKEASTVAVITRVGDDRHTWEVKSSKVGGDDVPVRRVTFRRAAE